MRFVVSAAAVAAAGFVAVPAQAASFIFSGVVTSGNVASLPVGATLSGTINPLVLTNIVAGAEYYNGTLTITGDGIDISEAGFVAIAPGGTRGAFVSPGSPAVAVANVTAYFGSDGALTGRGLLELSYLGQSLRVEDAALTLPVPEPATWAMMIAGFGMIGAMTRRSRQIASA